MAALNLDQADKNSAAWQKVTSHLEARLDELRQQNDGNLDPIATARIRGKIELAKELLAPNKARPEFRPVSASKD